LRSRETLVELSEENDGGKGEGVVASLVLIFAGLGLVIDGICLAAYYHYAKRDADFKYQEMITLSEAEGKDLEKAKAEVQMPEINMLSALLHVSADLMRSTCTFIEGLFLFFVSLTPAKQEYIDTIVGIIIGATIIAASVYALYEWIVAFWEWFTGLGNTIEVECLECTAQIEIKPDIKRVTEKLPTLSSVKSVQGLV